MAKKMKKVNPKDTAKANLMKTIRESLEQLEISVEDGVEFGFTKGTLVIHAPECDIQLKPITPKAGIDRYAKDEDEEEEE